MRIRKRAWARPELENCKFYIDKPEQNKGKWHECFAKEQPIHVELGCGKGRIYFTNSTKKSKYKLYSSRFNRCNVRACKKKD